MTGKAIVPSDRRAVQIATSMLRDSRLAILFDAVENSGTERALAVPDDIAAALPALAEYARVQLSPADDDQLEIAFDDIIALIGGAMSQPDRVAWRVAATSLLMELPGDLTVEGLRDAMRHCEHTRQIVPHVFEYARAGKARRQKFLANIEALTERLALTKEDR